VAAIAQPGILGGALDHLLQTHGPYKLLDHWKQGEFHHDVVVEVAPLADAPGAIVVIATNCNGGVKEVLAFDVVPDRYALWNARCPDNAEFEGELPPLKAGVRTWRHFDPCLLLVDDARSEIKPEHRVRMRGGGWRMKDDGE